MEISPPVAEKKIFEGFLPYMGVATICHRLNCDNCLGGVMGSVLMCIFNVD